MHQVFGLVISHDSKPTLSKRIIQFLIASVNPETPQATQLTRRSHHKHLVQACSADHLRAYLLVPASEHEALTANWRDDDLGALPTYRLKYLVLVHVMRDYFLVKENVNAQECFFLV
jgi:hypothetical protein